jgi:hypothetical protein
MLERTTPPPIRKLAARVEVVHELPIVTRTRTTITTLIRSLVLSGFVIAIILRVVRLRAYNAASLTRGRAPSVSIHVTM